jgi:hypothetical protein
MANGGATLTSKSNNGAIVGKWGERYNSCGPE